MNGDNIGSRLKKKAFHHGDLKEAAFVAVANLADKHRSLEFTLSDVANILGTTQPALYKHFADRTDLLTATALKGHDIFVEIRRGALEGMTGGPLAELIAFANSYVVFAAQHQGFYLLIRFFQFKGELKSEAYQPYLDNTITQLRSIIQRGIDEGLFNESDIGLIAASTNITWTGLSNNVISGNTARLMGKSAEDAELSETMIRLSLSVFLSPKGKRHLAALPYQSLA